MSAKVSILSVLIFIVGVDAYSAADVLAGAQKCILDICGPRETVNMENPIRPPAHLQRIDADYQKLVAPQIKSEIEHTIRVKRKRLQLLDLLSRTDLEEAEYSPDLVWYANYNQFYTYIDMFASRGAIRFVETEGRYFLNRLSARFLIEDASEVDVEALLKGMEELIETGFFNLALRNNGQKLSIMHKNALPDISYGEFLKVVFGDIEAGHDRFQKVVPFLNIPRSPVRERFSAGEPITDEHSADVTSEIATALLIQCAFECPGVSAFLKETKPLRRYREQALKQIRILTGLRSRLERALTATELSVSKAQATAHCEGRFKRVLRSFPLAEEVALFQSRTIPRAMSTAERVLIKQGLTDIVAPLRELKWQMPLSYELALKGLSRNLEENAKQNAHAETFLEALAQSLLVGDKIGIARALVSFQFLDPTRFDEALHSVTRFCDEVKPMEPIDAFSLVDQLVYVGWQPILYVETALGTLGHEIGHFVYELAQAASNPRLQNKMQCLSDRHKGIDLDPDTFMNEDFADMFSGAIEKEVRSLSPLKRQFCFSQPEAGQPDWMRHFSLKADTGWLHSSTLFRLISHATEVGSLPQSCKTLQESVGMKNIGVGCWEK